MFFLHTHTPDVLTCNKHAHDKFHTHTHIKYVFIACALSFANPPPTYMYMWVCMCVCTQPSQWNTAPERLESILSALSFVTSLQGWSHLNTSLFYFGVIYQIAPPCKDAHMLTQTCTPKYVGTNICSIQTFGTLLGVHNDDVLANCLSQKHYQTMDGIATWM